MVDQFSNEQGGGQTLHWWSRYSDTGACFVLIRNSSAIGSAMEQCSVCLSGNVTRGRVNRCLATGRALSWFGLRWAAGADSGGGGSGGAAAPGPAAYCWTGRGCSRPRAGAWESRASKSARFGCAHARARVNARAFGSSARPGYKHAGKASPA